MVRSRIIGLVASLLILGCSTERDPSFSELLNHSPSISGKTDYLASPYVTAGDRVYMVGHQDGSFPEIGWHIPGEMGGIWDHPIKLMDGFSITLTSGEESIILDGANLFINYPMANKHLFAWEDQNLEIERIQFVPDGMEGLSIQLILNNTAEQNLKVDLVFDGASDLSPTWLGDRTGMVDSQDIMHFDKNLNTWVAKDSLNPWFVIFGSNQVPLSHDVTANDYKGNGASGKLNYTLDVQGGASAQITFTIAGSYQSLAQAENTYRDIQNNANNYLVSKRDRYQELADRTKLTIPDQDLQQTFEWLKYNCDWLIRTVPEIGTGIMAGIPDYPWWFGVDSEYALKGYMAIGQYDIVLQTIELLDSISEAVNGNGRIVHEVSSNGAVFNPGNINETPQFASLVWEVYRWTGDRGFLEKYYPAIEKGLEWLMAENDQNDNLFPEGFGMMEIHGLNSEMIDVASYTQRAFEDASKISKVLGADDKAELYQGLANSLKERINRYFWAEEFGSYADFIGSDEQAIKLIEEAIVRADTLDKPWAIEELEETKQSILSNPGDGDRPFVTHHNWVVNTPLEMKIADQETAIAALETAWKFTNPFGVFVTGIDRDESAGSDDGSFQGAKVFSYTGAVMTLPTGVQVVAENNYGRVDEGLQHLKNMTRSFSYALPGSMYEVSPDYGMMTQAWNIYSFAVPIVQQFFGIEPDAGAKRVTVRPNMPKDWNEAKLENVRVANNTLDIYYERADNDIHLKVSQLDDSWELIVELSVPETAEIEVSKGSITRVGNRLTLTAEPQQIEVGIIF